MKARKRIDYRRIKLTPEEQAIEDSDDFVPAGSEVRKMMSKAIARAVFNIQRRKKDAVLHIRINGEDLELIKRRAKGLGVPYQTFVAECLHQLAA